MGRDKGRDDKGRDDKGRDDKGRDHHWPEEVWALEKAVGWCLGLRGASEPTAPIVVGHGLSSKAVSVALGATPVQQVRRKYGSSDVACHDPVRTGVSGTCEGLEPRDAALELVKRRLQGSYYHRSLLDLYSDHKFGTKPDHGPVWGRSPMAQPTLDARCLQIEITNQQCCSKQPDARTSEF
ncbi:hypothetical protein V491_06776 [Pseudogymnoascus sp. VKM F-3775]|nr:hypothetical protein V491_06776 [Pseudogymnoascus sp. VKM F-3775]